MALGVFIEIIDDWQSARHQFVLGVIGFSRPNKRSDDLLNQHTTGRYDCCALDDLVYLHDCILLKL